MCDLILIEGKLEFCSNDCDLEADTFSFIFQVEAPPDLDFNRINDDGSIEGVNVIFGTESSPLCSKCGGYHYTYVEITGIHHDAYIDVSYQKKIKKVSRLERNEFRISNKCIGEIMQNLFEYMEVEITPSCNCSCHMRK